MKLDRLNASELVKDELRDIACWEIVGEILNPHVSWETVRGHRLPKIITFLPDDFGHRLQAGTASEVMISLADLAEQFGVLYEHWPVLDGLHEIKGEDALCREFHGCTYKNESVFLPIFDNFRRKFVDKVPSKSDLDERRNRLAQAVRVIPVSD
jgi:hypothetical protein